VRLVGILLVLPLPLAFAAGSILGLLFGKDATGYAVITEYIIIIGVAIVASIAFRRIRRPIADPNSVEALSAKRGNRAVSVLFIILLLVLLAPLICIILVYGRALLH
jgi:hypothetical protein